MLERNKRLSFAAAGKDNRVLKTGKFAWVCMVRQERSLGLINGRLSIYADVLATIQTINFGQSGVVSYLPERADTVMFYSK